VSSVVAPGQAEYETLVDRLGEDVFYGDVNGDVSFTPGVDLLYVLGAPFVGTGDFASAAVVPPRPGDRDPWQVSFTLTTDAGERLSVATTEAVGGKIAIVGGDRVLSAPTVQEPVTSGNGVVPAVSRQEAERIVRLMLGD
jgi:preprotein translocase subunit SecD